MTGHHEGINNPGRKPLEKDRPGDRAKDAGESDCRCKEGKGKTLPQLLKLMAKDLVFWRKNK